MEFRIGQYRVTLTPETQQIFPENARGDRVMVILRRVYLTLERTLPNGRKVEICFKHYKHRRDLLWRDTRWEKKGACQRRHIVQELARILFEGDREQAEDLTKAVEILL